MKAGEVEQQADEVLSAYEVRTAPVDVLAIATAEGIELAEGDYAESFCGRIEYHRDVGGFVLLSILIGLLSGIYPAFFLSGFKPINSLKGKLNSSSKGIGLRRILVLSQFSISIILVTGTLVVFQQLGGGRFT